MPPPLHYLAVLKASYDYAPQSNDELNIVEDQLLFLVERTDEDWWKVKIKGEGADDNTPSGLVPSAYLEPAVPTSTVKALYDYAAADSGELTIQEDESLLAFEQDGDWLLVQSNRSGGMAGYVPANYIEVESEGAATEVPAAAPAIVIPSSPPRPTSVYVDPAERVANAKATADDIKTWSVAEVDQKGKKKKGTLGIGNGAVFFASESDKNPVQKWQTSDVTQVSIEKSKHVHITIGGANPISLHFSTGSRDIADAIEEKMRSSKELSSEAAEPDDEELSTDMPPSRDAPPKAVHFSAAPNIIPDPESEEEEEEPDAPARSAPPRAAPSRGEDGVALYDFTADGDDELSVREGDKLIVLERDNDDWWKCTNAKGQEGVVPASYVEVSNPRATSSRAPAASAEEDSDHEAEEAAAQAAAEEEERRRREEDAARQEEQRRAQKEMAEKQKKKDAEARARKAAEDAEAERKKRKAEKAAAERARSQAASPPSSKDTIDSSEKRKSKVPDATRASVDGPPPERVRTWHDRSGQFRVDAAFLGYNNNKLRLHKVNGVIVEVPADRMSTEDLKYVEKHTQRQSRAPQSTSKRVSDDDVPLGVQHPHANKPQAKKAPQVDWFAFFLEAGCDPDDCTRYASSFERDKIDEALLPDITEGTMRSLGLREGDIIRTKKHIDKKFPKANPESTPERKQSGPAPNLFSSADGSLKAPRRGRPQPKGSLPTTVDLNSIPESAPPRTDSPLVATPAVSASPVQPPTRGSSIQVNGFDDDAWTNRPSSTKPVAPSPSPAPARAPSAPLPAAVQVAPTPPPASPAPPASVPPPTTMSAPQIQTTPAPTSGHLANVTDQDIFAQLSRLSQLRTASPAPASPAAPSPPVASPPPIGYQSGLGMGSSPSPMGQIQQQRTLQPPIQQYNGPLGPFAPVPANQSLLQPLIPTQTGFGGFVPTRAPVQMSSPFQNPQPTGFNPSPQPMISQPTGFGNFNNPSGFNPSPISANGSFGVNGNSGFGGQPGGGFGTLQPNPTGFNPNFGGGMGGGMLQSQPTGYGQSPFGNAFAAPPPVPPLPSNNNTNNTNPANIFAQMKSGTFDSPNDAPQDANRYDALRPNYITAQPTGWMNYGGR